MKVAWARVVAAAEAVMAEAREVAARALGAMEAVVLVEGVMAAVG